MPITKKKLLVFASGTGTLFEAIVKACQNNILPATVLSLITDNKKAFAIQKATYYKIPVKIFSQKDYASLNQWDMALTRYSILKKPDWILLAGFLKQIRPKMLRHFKTRMINIHPSLLPSHGGKGMYGSYVHQSVLKHKDKITGITVHFVSSQYDKGTIIAQKKISVSSNDTVISLQRKVKKQEKKFYISVLQSLLQKEGDFANL